MSIQAAPPSTRPLQFGKIRFTSALRIPELDSVRGLAILLVMFYHFFGFTQDQITQRTGTAWTGISKIALLLTRPGFLGVDLFFVLSGFLITGILLDSKGDPHFLRNFYGRRVLRILPLYLSTLAILLVCYRGSGPFVGISLLFLANMAHLFGIEMTLSPLWSLAVEEHFYLIWPWIIRSVRMRTVAMVSIVLILIEPVVRLASRQIVYDVYFYSWFRFDGLAWGALIACFVRSQFCTIAGMRRAIPALAITGLAIILAGAPFGILHRSTPIGALLQFTAAEMIFASVVVFAIAFSGLPAAAAFRNPFTRLTGDLSYCLYITHFMVRDAYDAAMARFGITLDTGPFLFSRVALRAVVVMAFCYGVAALSRKYLELPALRLKRYFSPAKAVSTGVPAANPKA